MSILALPDGGWLTYWRLISTACLLGYWSRHFSLVLLPSNGVLGLESFKKFQKDNEEPDGEKNGVDDSKCEIKEKDLCFDNFQKEKVSHKKNCWAYYE